MRKRSRFLYRSLSRGSRVVNVSPRVGELDDRVVCRHLSVVALVGTFRDAVQPASCKVERAIRVWLDRRDGRSPRRSRGATRAINQELVRCTRDQNLPVGEGEKRRRARLRGVARYVWYICELVGYRVVFNKLRWTVPTCWPDGAQDIAVLEDHGRRVKGS
jgi:hypothetical protein